MGVKLTDTHCFVEPHLLPMKLSEQNFPPVHHLNY